MLFCLKSSNILSFSLAKNSILLILHSLILFYKSWSFLDIVFPSSGYASIVLQTLSIRSMTAPMGLIVLDSILSKREFCNWLVKVKNYSLGYFLTKFYYSGSIIISFLVSSVKL